MPPRDGITGVLNVHDAVAVDPVPAGVLGGGNGLTLSRCYARR